MKIVDKVKDFKDFLSYTSLKGDKCLFGTDGIQFEKGVGTAYLVEDLHVAAGKVIYRPKESDNGYFWCDPARLIDSKKGKMKSMISSDDVEIVSKNNNITGKSGIIKFSMPNIDKDTSEYGMEGGSGFVKAKEMIKDINVVDGKLKGMSNEFFNLTVDSNIFQNAIKNKDTMVNPSYFMIRVNKGKVLLVVEDEAEKKNKEFIEFHIGDIDKTVSFETTFGSYISNIFNNLSGDVDVFIGDIAPIIVHQIIVEKSGLDDVEKFELLYLLSHTIEDDTNYDDDENEEESLEEDQGEETTEYEEFESDDLTEETEQVDIEEIPEDE